MIGLIGRKKGMTRLFGQNGESIPVTAIVAEPCQVVQVKTNEKEGYQAIQLGAFGQRKKQVRKPQLGHFAKAGVEPKAKLAEFRVDNVDQYQPGQQLRVDIFQEGDRVKVTGTSKGKGFTGGVKRWGFKGGPKSHGQSDRHRAPGSIGGASWPSRVWKGMKMAGRMGNERVSIRNLEVVKVDLENNLLLVKGAVPGARNSYVLIQRLTELIAMPASAEDQEETKAKKRAADKAEEELAAAAATTAAPEVSEKEEAAEPKDAATEEGKSAEGQPESEIPPAEDAPQEEPETAEEKAPEETSKPESSEEEIPVESKGEPKKASSEENLPGEGDAAPSEETEVEKKLSSEKKPTAEKKE